MCTFHIVERLDLKSCSLKCFIPVTSRLPGGKVDLSHHKNWAAKALEEAYQFNKAVQVAVDETSPEDTLIVVTADHSHGLTINGYAQRGTPILGEWQAGKSCPFKMPTVEVFTRKLIRLPVILLNRVESSISV